MNLQSVAASRITGRPWAIAPARLDSLLGSALALTPGAELPSWLQDANRPRGYTVTDSGIAVVPVLGPLVARSDWLTLLLGATEYGGLADALAAAADDPAVSGIVLEVDSPGGEVGGLFDLVDSIRAIKAEAGKPLWAVASEAALSAAYAIASAADRLYVTRTGEVGSVGVVAVHLDESGADAIAGLNWTLIHAGVRKTDGNPHEPLSPRASADIQADVDHLHDQLVALVAANRGLNPDAVRVTEAAIYRGEKAVTAGLADRIGTVSKAIADLAAALEAQRIRTGPPANRRPYHPPTLCPGGRQGAARQSAPPARNRSMSNPDPLIDDPATAPADPAGNSDAIPDGPNAETQAPPVRASDPPPFAAAPDAQAIADRLRNAFAEIATVAAQAARLGLEIDAADAMRRGLKPDALRQTILEKLAARSEAADVVAIAPPPSTAGDSPIVRRARERAAGTR